VGRRGPADPCCVANRGAGLERLILDTTVLVDAERRGGALDELIGDEDDVAVAAVTVAELLVGIELGRPRLRKAREGYLARLVETIPVEPYDLEVARAHAALLAHTSRAGRPRGAHDLIIAATATARRRTVVTAVAAGFEDLPGVSVRF
jgi:tRNA(fMet)-specific endonuclease VapC